jgi:DNA-binding CsgD family transcriptional regulator
VFAVLERGGADARVDTGTVQSAVTHLLADLARDGVAVVIDEWQWLDPETVRVLQHALERPVVARSTPVVIARRADGSADDRGLRPLFPPTSVITVPPLRPASLRSVLRQFVGDSLPATLIEELSGRSAGNPLWAIELAAARLSGDPRRAAPGSVFVAMQQRISSLPTAVRSALELVAVLGRPRLADVVGNAVGVDRPTVDLAVELDVLRLTDDVVVVAHPLLAAASVELLGPDERRRLHARAARLPLGVAQRLEHHDLGEAPGPDEELAEALVDGAVAALKSGGVDTALRLARRSLARTPLSSPWRAARVLTAARAAFGAGRSAKVVTLIGELDPESVALETLDAAMDLLTVSLDRELGQRAVLQRLVALQDGLVVGSRRWSVLEVPRLARAGVQDADVVEQLVALAETMDPDVTPHAVDSAYAWAIAFGLDRGTGLDERLFAAAAEHERTHPAASFTETTQLREAQFPYQCDELQRSRFLLPTLARAAREAGDDHALADALGNAAALEVLAGTVARATELLAEARSVTEVLAHEPSSVQRARGMVAVAAHDRDTLDALVTREFAPTLEQRADLLRHGLLGLDAAHDGEWEQALVHLERALAVAEAHAILEPGRRLWIDVELGRALIHTGQVERAREAARTLGALGERPGRVHARGQARRLLALVRAADGDPVGALPDLDAALADLRAGGFASETLRASAERLRLLVELGRADEARAALPRDAGEAATIGNPRLVAEFDAVAMTLEAADVHLSLTAAEQRVAALVSAGRSNREVATELFVSVRTVETHLARVYRKLDVRTRTQLALRFRDTDS